MRSALVFGFVLCAARAAAEPGDATRLEFARSERATACPDASALKRAVAKRLGYDPFFPAARQAITVTISDTGTDLLARMNLIDEKGVIVGSRELRETLGNCDELVTSLALAISIALDPSAALERESAEAEFALAPEEEAETATVRGAEPTAAQPVSPPSPERKRRKRRATARVAQQTEKFALRASVFAALGIAPAGAVGARLGLSRRWDWLKVIAEAHDQLTVSRDGQNGGQVRVSLRAGLLAPCWTTDWLTLCGLLDAGSLRTEGVYMESSVSENLPYAATGARFELRGRIAGPFRLVLNADGLIPLTPVRLVLRHAEPWQTPLAWGAAGLGLEAQLP